MTRQVRAEHGQGLIEGVCGSVVFTMVFVALVMAGINIFAIFSYDAALKTVAQTAADAADGHKYFLGMKRPEFDYYKGQDKARTLALAVASTLGLSLAPQDITFDTIQAPGFAKGMGEITKCTVVLKQIKLPYTGGAFPSLIKREAVGVSASMAIGPVVLSEINFPTDGGGRMTLRLPAYGAYYVANTFFDKNTGKLSDSAAQFNTTYSPIPEVSGYSKLSSAGIQPDAGYINPLKNPIGYDPGPAGLSTIQYK